MLTSMNNLNEFEEWLAEVHFNNWQLKKRNYYMQTNITM